MEMVAVAMVLGAGIGLLLGMLGGGGSILTVPALVYIMGVPVAQATGTSLAIVGTTAVAGAIRHHRAGRVALRAALPFGAVSVAGSVAGSLLGGRIPGDLLLALFAFVMIAAGLAMLRRQAVTIAESAERPAVPAVRVAAAGFGVGLLTGFFGVGGGFVIVPALTMVLGLNMATAIGTSLVVIAIASAAGLIIHVGAGAFDPAVTALFVVGGVAGIVAGSHVAGRLPERSLRTGFATLVFLLAAYLLVRNHAALGLFA